MAANTNPIFPNVINISGRKIVNADSTNFVDIFTAGANGSKVENIIITSTDSADKTVQLAYYDTTTAFILGELLIPDGSGTNGTDLPISLLDTFAWYLGYLHLKASHKLQMKVKTAVTSGSYDLQVTVFGGDF